MKVLTENKEELAIKDLVESDIDDIPQVEKKEVLEEVNIGDDESDDDLFDPLPELDDDEDDFVSKDLFDDEDDTIDTTIPDVDFEDDFDLDDEDL